MKNAFVADDDEFVRSATVRLLKMMGYAVDEASSYVTARELLDTRSYDLIICDNAMPLGGERRPDRTCGLQLLAWVKGHGPNVDTLFVLHTADDNEQTISTVRELGGFYRNKMSRESWEDFLKPLIAR